MRSDRVNIHLRRDFGAWVRIHQVGLRIPQISKRVHSASYVLHDGRKRYVLTGPKSEHNHNYSRATRM